MGWFSLPAVRLTFSEHSLTLTVHGPGESNADRAVQGMVCAGNCSSLEPAAEQRGFVGTREPRKLASN